MIWKCSGSCNDSLGSLLTISSCSTLGSYLLAGSSSPIGSRPGRFTFNSWFTLNSGFTSDNYEFRAHTRFTVRARFTTIHTQFTSNSWFTFHRWFLDQTGLRLLHIEIKKCLNAEKNYRSRTVPDRQRQKDARKRESEVSKTLNSTYWYVQYLSYNPT